jgi:hypothetical protein
LPAVPELHLRQIVRYCEQRVPEHARDQVQVSSRIRGRSVTIVERRSPWRADFGPEWSSRPVAQLRWTPSPTAGDEGPGGCTGPTATAPSWVVRLRRYRDTLCAM